MFCHIRKENRGNKIKDLVDIKASLTDIDVDFVYDNIKEANVVLPQKTALMYAAGIPEEISRDFVEMLLEAGANPDIRHEHTGRTALMYASNALIIGDDAKNKLCYEIITLLIGNGAQVDLECKEGKTALDYAKERLGERLDFDIKESLQIGYIDTPYQSPRIGGSGSQSQITNGGGREL